ncbi:MULTISPECIES: hypothetical protein [unclassified Acidovorax]|uniref:hypothetical protein n=1 Tax=unclassified Acidovorax TaxID=2684926 RepID=UPI000B2BD0CA|nr:MULTISPECIES: hypothetical protein [unclassified Acidovorax]
MPRIRYLPPTLARLHGPPGRRRERPRGQVPQSHLGAGWWAPRTSQLARHAVHADGLPASAYWPAPQGWRGPAQPRVAATAGLLRQAARQAHHRHVSTQSPSSSRPVRAALRRPRVG